MSDKIYKMSRSGDESISPIAIERHRNGISGEGFYVVEFEYTGSETEPTRMIAIVFEPDSEDPDVSGFETTEFHNPRVAVFDYDKLKQGEFRFFHNSWRGDNFAPALYEAIKEWER